ncbi:MAG: amphi-Trp domain-containing protein [Actinophytocola sp.]|uniref:amphi-Trp domain-containing protein n=1 Tax=Actinophytocola sp. TaxID=1872138 RepID=UPI003C72DD0C
MSDIEVKREETLTRAEAAKRLAALAEGLADGGAVEFALGASTVKVHVPDKVRVEVEIEIDGDEVELEVELKWHTGKAAPSAPAAPARRRTRGSKA